MAKVFQIFHPNKSGVIKDSPTNIKIRQHKIIEPFVRRSDLMILMIGDKIKYLKSDFISPNKKSHYYRDLKLSRPPTPVFNL